MFLSSFRSSNVAVVWRFSRQLLKLFFFCCRCYCVFPKSFVLIPLHTGTQLSDTVVNSWLAGWRQLANVSEGMQSELGTCLFFLLFLLLFLSLLFFSLSEMSFLLTIAVLVDRDYVCRINYQLNGQNIHRFGQSLPFPWPLINGPRWFLSMLMSLFGVLSDACSLATHTITHTGHLGNSQAPGHHHCLLF